MNISISLIGTLVAILIGGLMPAVATIIMNRHTLGQIKLQWEREEKRDERKRRKEG